MQKNISTQTLRSRIGAVIDEVQLRGSRFIIERKGKPVAALVPIPEEDSNETDRANLFRLMEQVANKNRGIPSKRIDEAIEESIREARKIRRSEKSCA
jgi:prevent-host-death family protein